MIKLIRSVLVVLFCAALVGASGLFFYVRTTEDNTPPVFHIEADPIENKETVVIDPDTGEDAFLTIFHDLLMEQQETA